MKQSINIIVKEAFRDRFKNERHISAEDLFKWFNGPELSEYTREQRLLALEYLKQDGVIAFQDARTIWNSFAKKQTGQSSVDCDSIGNLPSMGASNSAHTRWALTGIAHDLWR